MKLYILSMVEFRKSKYCTETTKHKKQHQAGKLLLQYALGDEVYRSSPEYHEARIAQGENAYRKAVFAKGEHGKPYIVGYPIHYNISHSGEYVVLVTAKTEVGVDVQEKRATRMEAMAKRFFSKEEWQAFSECDSEEEKRDLFYYIWCCKEAYGKYLGTGLNAEVLQTNVFADIEDVQFIEYEAVEGYQICICCGKEESIEEVISVFEGL